MKNSFGFIQEKEFTVIRSFEEIGEASKKVEENLKNKYNQIPWRKMAGFRDVLIHDYNRVIYEVIWLTAKEELPGLNAQLFQILEDEQ